MNPIDDLFREGLSGHAGQVPTDMWTRINAGKTPVAPIGEGIDELFAGKLADRAGEVPTDMWARIAAVGATTVPEGVDIDQTFADKLREAEGEIPAGMWHRIWQATAAPAVYTYRRWLFAGLAALLLLSGVAWWQLAGDVVPVEELPVPTEVEVAANEGAMADLSTDDQATLATDQTENLIPGEREASVTVVAQSGANAGATTGVKAKEATPLVPQAADEVTVGEPAQEKRPTIAVRQAATSDQDEALPVKMIPVANTVPVANAAEAATATHMEGITVGTQALSSRSLALLPLEEAYPEIKRRHRVKPLENSSFRAAPRHRFQTEFLFGVAYANQDFSVADEANRLLLSAREVSEYPEASYQVTLRTNYRIGEHLLLTGGFTYTEIRNQLEYQQVFNGLSTDVRINNSIRLLEAPLLLGYRLPGRRLHVALNAGPVINLSTSARGRFLSPDAPQPLDLATDGNYRRHIGVGLMTSLSTTYRIGDKEPFLLVVEPFFKTYPGAFTVKGAPLREKYWVAGLQLGIRKEF
jgi:hypothetical protein